MGVPSASNSCLICCFLDSIFYFLSSFFNLFPCFCRACPSVTYWEKVHEIYIFGTLHVRNVFIFLHTWPFWVVLDTRWRLSIAMPSLSHFSLRLGPPEALATSNSLNFLSSSSPVPRWVVEVRSMCRRVSFLSLHPHLQKLPWVPIVSMSFFFVIVK